MLDWGMVLIGFGLLALIGAITVIVMICGLIKKLFSKEATDE